MLFTSLVSVVSFVSLIECMFLNGFEFFFMIKTKENRGKTTEEIQKKYRINNRINNRSNTEEIQKIKKKHRKIKEE